MDANNSKFINSQMLCKLERRRCRGRMYWNRNRRSPSILVTRIQYYNHANGNCLLSYVRYVLLFIFDLLPVWNCGCDSTFTLIVCRPPAGKSYQNKKGMCSISKFIVGKCMQSKVFARACFNSVFGLVDRESSESNVFVWKCVAVLRKHN